MLAVIKSLDVILILSMSVPVNLKKDDWLGCVTGVLDNLPIVNFRSS